MIEIIHVINLSPQQPLGTYTTGKEHKIIENRVERAMSVVEQSKKYGFAVRFWPGNYDLPEKRWTNISKAFKQIVRYAKEKKLRMITIAEDDILLTSKNAWNYYNEQMPKDFDLYLGGVYNGQLKQNRIVNGYSGNTLVTVHERFYDFFLKADENMDLDNYLGNWAYENNYIVCLPFVVKQIGKWSDHKKKINPLDIHEKKWTFYQE